MARSTLTNILYASQFDERMARLKLKAQSSYFDGLAIEGRVLQVPQIEDLALLNPACSGYDGEAVPVVLPV